MPLFGPPNVSKMKDKRDVKGLIKALSDRKECGTRYSAAWVLGRQVAGGRWKVEGGRKVTVILKMTVT